MIIFHVLFQFSICLIFLKIIASTIISKKLTTKPKCTALFTQSCCFFKNKWTKPLKNQLVDLSVPVAITSRLVQLYNLNRNVSVPLNYVR